MKKGGLNKHNLPGLLLRVGLATVFLYASISSFKNPQDWVGYLPRFLKDMLPAGTLLKLFSVYEISLAIWLLSGKFVKYAGLLSALTLSGIVLANFSLFAISFRDIGLIFASLALVFIKE
ncbi:MAG TPA: DoxX family membrane protein [Candidatus Saccharimonadales bacterium]|nr:DoxX family membrane protein [Candidatus Saccharimonadales bacterium]